MSIVKVDQFMCVGVRLSSLVLQVEVGFDSITSCSSPINLLYIWRLMIGDSGR